MRVKRGVALLAIVAALGLPVVLQAALTPGVQTAGAQTAAKATDKKERDGKWELPDGTPTFNIGADGTVDWYTYSGFRRYHAECHVCHGPDGEGSTYAPGLVESLKTMSYPDFMLVVASGRQNVGAGKESVMPALGDNPNVMCYIDDIYVYLKARAVGGLPRGRPAKRADKPAAATQHEKACFGHK
jgi:methanol metabolism-related c-type cytochrome